MRRLLDLLIGGLSAIALMLFSAVGLARYVAPTLALDWSDEVVIMLLVWAMFLACYRLTLDRAHICVDLLTHRLSPRWQRRLHVISTSAFMLYAAGMMFAGAVVVHDALTLNERTESTAQIPVFIYFASLPVGMALMAWATSRRLLGRATRSAMRSAENAL